MDYGTLDRRRALCHEEVRLNRRLAPDVYRGVRTVVPATDGGFRFAAEHDDPRAVEYAVEMRRYDEDATLLRPLAVGTAGETDVSAAGRRLAEFHAAAATPREPGRTVARLWSMLDENFTSLRALVPPLANSSTIPSGWRRPHSAAGARSFSLGPGAGLVRDGHGDLRAEHVVLERGSAAGGVGGLDLSGPNQRDLGADERALRAEEADAAELLDLADRLGWSVRLGDVAVVCGVAASGKSTLAAALAERAGATVISSDVVRKQSLGIDPTARAPAGAYADEVNRRTYDALGRLAWRPVDAGGLVVVDATFRFAGDRGRSPRRADPQSRPYGSSAARPRPCWPTARRGGRRIRSGSPTPTRAQWAARSRSGSRSTSYRPIGASPW